MNANAFNLRNFGNDLFSIKNALAVRAFVYSLRQRVTEEVFEENNVLSQFEKTQYFDVISNAAISGSHSNLHNYHNTHLINTLIQDFMYVSLFVLLSSRIFKSINVENGNANAEIECPLTCINKNENGAEDGAENDSKNIAPQLFPSKLKQFDLYYDANRLARMFLLIFYIIFTKNIESAT
jgi:hypothetical protein